MCPWEDTPCGSIEWLSDEMPPKVDIYLAVRRVRVDGEWSYRPMVRIMRSAEAAS